MRLNASLFLVLLLWSIQWSACSKVYHTTNVVQTVYKVEKTDNSDAHATITTLIAPYKAKLDAQMNTEIANCPITLTKAQPESTIGNWLADAILFQSKTYTQKKIDVAIQNYGGIRIPSISEGKLSRRTIYELMPFDNRLVLVDLNGLQLQQFFSHMATKGGWPISSTARYKIKDKTATDIHIHNEAIIPSKLYTIALPDYVANGGDQCDFLIDQPKVELDILIRTALLEYLEAHPSMEAVLDGRVILVE